MWSTIRTLKEKQKYCYKCKAVKPTEMFWGDSSRMDGYTNTCKICFRIAKVLNDKKPKAKYRAYRSNAKHSKKLLKFCLSLDEFMTFWQKPCFYCDSPIETIGLDRIDNSQDYYLKNVVSCCWACNQLKSNLTIKDMSRITQIAKKLATFYNLN